MIQSRSIANTKGVGDFSGDFLKVRDFLRSLQQNQYYPMSYPWGRWEWMFSLPYFDTTYIDKIRIWEEEGTIVALATYESSFGEGYYVNHPSYSHLKHEVASYIVKEYTVNGKVRILIPDQDSLMQTLIRKHGLTPTDHHEYDAVIDLETATLDYPLPIGFSVVSLAEDNDMMKYHRVLWNGFNHQGEDENLEVEIAQRRVSLSGPDVNLHHNIAVKSPNGAFVSYCGIWHKDNDFCALVEPVATDPAYRKMGLGKAAVLESLRRVKAAGAKCAVVGSSQVFYYRIGFNPKECATWWESNLDQNPEIRE